jgi:TetR/AcrR family transcriptional regulator, regulator of autoinduction and epiphytic fitness
MSTTSDGVPETWDGEALATDGRLARGQRTRRKVAEALVTLLEQGNPDPTARAIAEQAGVSLRLVFHHFEDMEDLYRAVSALQLERHWRQLPKISSDLPTEKKVERSVRVRSVLFEEISPVRRMALRRAENSPSVAAIMTDTNRLLRISIATTFGPELGAIPPTEAEELLEALDNVAAWETWERMRRTNGLSVTVARQVVARTLFALLAVAPIVTAASSDEDEEDEALI